jgi:hypothetical protein
VTLTHYRIAAADGAGPEYPEGQLLSVHQEDEAEDFTHWIDWAEGHFVVWPECRGQIEIADQAIAYPLERA